jgi:hypothetical protein
VGAQTIALNNQPNNSEHVSGLQGRGEWVWQGAEGLRMHVHCAVSKVVYQPAGSQMLLIIAI